jgi:hypothetical protein
MDQKPTQSSHTRPEILTGYYSENGESSKKMYEHSFLNGTLIETKFFDKTGLIFHQLNLDGSKLQARDSENGVNYHTFDAKFQESSWSGKQFLRYKKTHPPRGLTKVNFFRKKTEANFTNC